MNIFMNLEIDTPNGNFSDIVSTMKKLEKEGLPNNIFFSESGESCISLESINKSLVDTNNTHYLHSRGVEYEACVISMENMVISFIKKIFEFIKKMFSQITSILKIFKHESILMDNLYAKYRQKIKGTKNSFDVSLSTKVTYTGFPIDVIIKCIDNGSNFFPNFINNVLLHEKKQAEEIEKNRKQNKKIIMPEYKLEEDKALIDSMEYIKKNFGDIGVSVSLNAPTKLQVAYQPGVLHQQLTVADSGFNNEFAITNLINKLNEFRVSVYEDGYDSIYMIAKDITELESKLKDLTRTNDSMIINSDEIQAINADLIKKNQFKNAATHLVDVYNKIGYLLDEEFQRGYDAYFKCISK